MVEAIPGIKDAAQIAGDVQFGAQLAITGQRQAREPIGGLAVGVAFPGRDERLHPPAQPNAFDTDRQPSLAAIRDLEQVGARPGDDLQRDVLSLDRHHHQGGRHGLGAAGIVCDQRCIRETRAQGGDGLGDVADGLIEIVRGNLLDRKRLGRQPELGWDIRQAFDDLGAAAHLHG